MPTATAEKKAVKKTSPKKEPALAPQDNSSFAIIETGGKQYQVAVGDSIKIEIMPARKTESGGKVEFKEGDKVTFDKVLLTESGGTTTIGTPYVASAKVTGTITEIGRNKKVTVIHYKQKSRYFKKAGHRQPFFKVMIESIGG